MAVARAGKGGPTRRAVGLPGGLGVRLALAVGLLLAGTPAWAIIGESEPNDTPATAHLLTPSGNDLSQDFPPEGGGVVATGTIGPGDVDYFSFNMAVGELLTVQVKVDDEGAYDDPVIGVFRIGQPIFLTDDDSGPGYQPAFSHVVQNAGLWSVVVSGFQDTTFSGADHDESFAYRLVLGVATPPPPPPISEMEPNDDFASADPLPPSGAPFLLNAPGGVGVVHGSIAPGDVDYYAVPVETGRRLSASVFTGDGGAFYDPQMVVVFGFMLPADDDAGPGFQPAVEAVSPLTGNAYVAVTGFEDNAFDGTVHDETFDYDLVVGVPEPPVLSGLLAGVAWLALLARRARR